jgi:elongation factor G
MAVEVLTPEDFLGDIIGDLNSRRGRIEGMEPQQGGAQAIKAQVPLAEMFGYATTVRSSSQGRASYSMEPSHYEQVPKSVSDEIIAKAGGKVNA